MTRRDFPASRPAWSIRVYCDEESHSGRIATCADFVNVRREIADAHTGIYPLLEDAGATIDDWMIRVLVEKPGDPFALASVSTTAEEQHVVGEDFALTRPKTLRYRLRVECPLCSLTWVARAENASPILARLVRGGITTLSLRNLIAISS